MPIEPDKLWWSADELAAAELPDLPTSARRINSYVKAWRGMDGLARKRKGKGGGWEYHWTALPTASRQALLRDQLTKPKQRDPVQAWADYDALPQKSKDIAATRLSHLDQIDALIGAGFSSTAAVGQVASACDVSERTLFNWLGLIDGVKTHDRLAFLAPRHRMAKRNNNRKVDPAFFDLIKSDYLRLEKPSLTACYSRAVRVAKNEGIEIAQLHTVRRHYKANVSHITEVVCRHGVDAIKRFFPHQTRDKRGMRALQLVQGDYHKFDLFAKWPGEANPVRPQGVFLSDVYSGKILAYRLSVTANSHTVQLTIGDMVEAYGIPDAFLLDNGREFAAKMISGGVPNRYRFKVLEDDIPGLIPMLGSEIIWATPYSGQSKPIERAFRDLCDRVSKHPAFAGAYTGNTPLAKPENYGSRAVDLEEFRAVLAVEIAEHNARPDRRSQVAFGRSFDEVFEESYKVSPIRRATEVQRRLWLMGASGVQANSRNGEISIFDNRYWSEWMHSLAGKKIVARYDPDALHDGLHIYDLDGSYRGFAECLAAGGFTSVEDAKELARKRNAFVRKSRDVAASERELSAAELAERLKHAAPDPVADRPVAEIVRLAPAHSKAPRPAKPAKRDAETDARVEAKITQLQTRRPEPVAEKDSVERFQEAIALIELRDGGQALTPDQDKFLENYTASAEYRGMLRARNSAKNEQ